MNFYKNTLKYLKRCNFYNDIIDFTICDNKSKYISKNVSIIKKINTIFTKNTKKFNIKNHQKNR